ncbi:MAG: 2-C-methyl-D-erythritol 2,4-cyclodiphosphate synthase [Candidatus Neomarinimicrobiota bacterium]
MNEMKFKIGNGFDAHPFVEGRPLVLGGLTIPYDRGLKGHSDADVLVHAIIDALLGAAGFDDIGTHFPDSDAAYKNISSILLLQNVAFLLKKHQMQIGNIDSIIIAEQPKIRPYVREMRSNLAAVLEIPEENISIKATTTEKMGFTGREEGIAAFASAIIFK